MSKEVTLNAKERRYEIHVDGTLAGLIKGREDDSNVNLVHTEVFDEFEGQGLAAELVAGALDDIRARGKKVIATCPYVARFIDKHAEYADLRA